MLRQCVTRLSSSPLFLGSIFKIQPLYVPRIANKMYTSVRQSVVKLYLYIRSQRWQICHVHIQEVHYLICDTWLAVFLGVVGACTRDDFPYIAAIKQTFTTPPRTDVSVVGLPRGIVPWVLVIEKHRYIYLRNDIEK